jgi:hypothetical protein
MSDRCEMLLSPGTVTVPRRGPPGSKTIFWASCAMSKFVRFDAAPESASDGEVEKMTGGF